MNALSQLRTGASGPTGKSGLPDGRRPRPEPARSPSAVYHVLNILTASVVTLTILYLAGNVFGQATGMTAGTDSPASNGVSHFFYATFCTYVALTVFPFALILGWGLRPMEAPGGNHTPFLSVVVPAFNEERLIGRSIRALQSQDYPAFEILIIDDGSHDFTRLIAERYGCRVLHIAKNLGKSHALNLGIREAAGEIVVFSDADSFVAPGALRALAAHFADPAVGAVAGSVYVHAPTTYLARCQQIEYTIGQVLVKVAQSLSSGAVTVCPGPLSAYRKKALWEVGGFKSRTMTEDHDATLEIVRGGQRVAYAALAVAYTAAAPTWRALARQRLRWFYGNLQTAWLHRDLLFRRNSGTFGWFWLPYGLFISAALPLVELLALIACVLVIAGAELPFAMALQGLAFIILLELIAAIQAAVALAISNRTTPRLLLTGLILKPCNVLLYWLRLKAIITFLMRRAPAW